MANISSQKKRIRQDEKKNLRNKDKKTALRSSIKAILNSEDTVEKEQKEYNSIYRDPEARSTIDAERMVVWGQELSWERSIIYRCQKAMDYFEEEG